jgi:hypothetical protein
LAAGQDILGRCENPEEEGSQATQSHSREKQHISAERVVCWPQTVQRKLGEQSL